MSHALRRPRALSGLALAAMLAGCMTPQIHPQLSQAVIDARERRDAPAAPACPPGALADVSPVMVGFPFDEATLANYVAQPLAPAAQWLACHPAIPVAIKPDGDGHGAAAAQDALARARAEGVTRFLTAHGVAGARISVLARGAAEPGGQYFLIRAEGRRW
jgi:outer membrane protein OmpA-like peptidoglycan-associated protein